MSREPYPGEIDLHARDQLIESLQADLAKKDQEIASWEKANSSLLEAIREGIKASVAKSAIIDDLEQQLEGQQAYIGRLEVAFQKEWLSHHGREGIGISQTKRELLWKEDEGRAKDALEKIRKS